MDNVRRAAVTALMKQERNGYANLVLDHALAELGGNARDAAFVSAIFYGTVERLVTLDYILQKFLSKPIEKLDAPVRAILRTGLCQARYMNGVPVHAAISESVTLTRQMGKTSAAGLVNAVLRRAANVDLTQEHFTDEIERLCVLYSVSRQVAQLLYSALPERCEALLAASFVPPRLCLRINTLRTSLEEVERTLQAQGVQTQRGTVPNSLYAQLRGDITALPLFQSGAVSVQGEASQLACAALAPNPGETVLDLCAAPGGKSVALAQEMHNEGRLLSCDVAENRLPLIKEAFARTGVTCATVLHNDAGVYSARFEGADAVLCDVPCSGLGILAKKPDIRYKTLESLPTLVALQARILATAARYVKPGGRLVYSTCTLNPAENEAVVRAFLRENPQYCTKSMPCIPPGAGNNDDFITLYPDAAKTDGFFVAKLERLW